MDPVTLSWVKKTRVSSAGGSAPLVVPESRSDERRTSFDAVGALFLTAGLVTVIALLLSLAMPNKELKGAGAPPPAADDAKPSLESEDDELAAIEMEAKASTML